MRMANIHIQDGREVFTPGETLRGRASWHGGKPPKQTGVRLYFYTMGKGTGDVVLVDEVFFEGPGAQDSRSFAFTLPESPYSFSGKLISLVWAVELILKGEKETAAKDFVLSPFGREVMLPGREEPAS